MTSSLRFHALCAAATALVLSSAAQADTLQATADIFNGSSYGDAYLGAGGYTDPENQPLGAVVGGGLGAFDMFGFYNSGTDGLTQQRQVELLSGNVFRFVDTFTNAGTTTVEATLNFFGNLGSDGDELVSVNANGLVVSCQDVDWVGSCAGQPVLALVSGNNGLGVVQLTADRYNVSFSLTLAPGQSATLLNFAFLASQDDGPGAADLSLAIQTGNALLSAPRVQGLSAQQLAGIVNYTVSSVPEPGSWALGLAGLAALALRAQRLRAHRG